MADRKPLKVLPDTGDSTGLGEFLDTDSLGVINGGTGLNAVGANRILTGHDSDDEGALTAESNLTFDGTTLNVVGNAGVGIARTDGTLHVTTSAVSGASANSSADDLVVEVNNNGGISILTPNDKTPTIAFGDPEDSDVGRIYYRHSSNSMEFFTNGEEELRILSGGGITFNGDTAAANALDDYEEGTWTIAVVCNSGSVTVNTSYNTGQYTKIGRQVSISGAFTASSVSSPSGQVTITGMPFSTGGSSADWEYRSAGSISPWAQTGTINSWAIFCVPAAAFFYIQDNGVNAEADHFTTNTECRFHMTYIV